jgi:glycosyltransferase involved in cell wall biosynthesis
MPAISVLMPVRNAGRYLASAIASLRRQSFGDFEVIAVEDGSTDGSGERLERFARAEPRLRLLRLPPTGLPGALQAGLTLARGELIARQDADDVSHPERFARQRALLLEHPEVDVVGCRLRLLPPTFAGLGMRRWVEWHNALLSHEEMAREVLVDSPLAHGSAMLRRPALERVCGWREFGGPEDLDLWVRLLRSGARFAKHPATLYAWRQLLGGVTRSTARCGREAFDALKLNALATGMLREHPRTTLIGVGASLERWTALLGSAGRVVHAVAAPRPTPASIDALSPPAVLVFGAAPARARWRAALVAAAWREGSDFLFVA